MSGGASAIQNAKSRSFARFELAPVCVGMSILPNRACALLGAALTIAALAGTPVPAEGQTPGSPALQDGMQHYRSGNPEAAIPAFERALESDSSQREAYVLLSSSLLQTGRVDRARRVAETGLERFPRAPALHLARAEALVQAERWPEALASYERVHRRARAGTSLPGGLSAEDVSDRIGRLHLQIGGTDLRDGNLDRALDHLTAARSVFPDSVSVHVQIALVHRARKDWPAAEAAAQTGLERFPRHPDLLRLRGEALYRQGKHDAMLPVFRRLYQQQPQDVEAEIAYGQALLAAGNQAEAASHFEALLDRHPRSETLYDALVRMHEQRMDVARVLEVLQRQRKQFPEDVDLGLRIGRIQEQRGEYRTARALYDSLRAVATPEDLRPGKAIAESFARQDRLEAAAAVYRDLLDRAPHAERILRGLASVREEQGRWADALPLYRRWAATDEDPAAHAQIGRVQEALGRPDSARAAYRRSLDRGVTHPRPAYRYAVLLHRHAESAGAPDTAGFRAAERALRRSLQSLQSLQRQNVMQMQGSARSRIGASDSLDQQRRRFETYNEVAEEAFRFFATSFPAEQTETVIQHLLDTYDRAGRLHYLAGTYYRDQNRRAEAVRHVRRATREAPDYRPANLALGALEAERGNLQTAILAYERARSLQPDAPDAYAALVRLYDRAGRLDALIRNWTARYESEPTDVLREHLVEALHKAGRTDDARQLHE